MLDSKDHDVTLPLRSDCTSTPSDARAGLNGADLKVANLHAAQLDGANRSLNVIS